MVDDSLDHASVVFVSKNGLFPCRTALKVVNTMKFQLVHEVGNRQRWRTKTPLSVASAGLIADEIQALEAVTGVVVNPRTGSVIVTYDTLAGRERVIRYLASLEKTPPIARAARAHYMNTLATRSALKAFQTERLHSPAVEALKQNRLIGGFTEAMDSGVRNMPLLTTIFYPIMRVFGFSVEKREETATKRLPSPESKHELVEQHFEVPEAKLDFGPLARYVLVNPFLPMLAQTANTILGGIPIIIEGVKQLFKGKLNVAVLDAASVAICLLRRDFKSAGLLILLLGMGEMLENYARKKSMASLAEQLSIKCDEVWVRRGEALEKIPLDSVTRDDVVVIRTGSVIPVDGVVVDGEAAINQATMTGEAVAVHRQVGGSVFAGTVVEDGEIGVRPTHIGDATRLAKIIQFVEDSEQAKANIESKALKIADAIVPFNFALAALVYFFTRDLTRTASVLLVDYSCALRLATPLAILSAMKEGTARGVIVKGGRYLEALAEIDTVVFDKTGTLTSSQPTLSDVVSLSPDWTEDEILRLSACLEEHFPHPVSRAVVKAADDRGLEHYDERHDTKVEYVVAHGICSRVDGQKVVLGSRHFVEDDEKVDCQFAQPVIQGLLDQGKTVLFLAWGGQLIGLICIEDPIRDESREVVQALRQRGKRIVMLTGDDQRTAAAVAQKLGITEYRAQVLPEDKASVVAQLKAQGAKVLMVGDGINDSPALSTADVGVTLRDSTDIAQEVADVVLTDSLMKLLTALDLGEATMRRIKQNVGYAVGLNTAFLAGGLTGLLTPMLSALFHNATTVGVCLNAMRPQLGHYDGEPHYLDEARADILDMVEQLKRVMKDQQANDVPPRIATTAHEGVAAHKRVLRPKAALLS